MSRTHPLSPAPPSEEERAFLSGYDINQFDRPSLAVDVVLLAPAEGQLHTLLVRRADHPFRGHWALPGGFVGITESLDEAAARVLSAKAGLEGVFLEQLYTFGEPGRDPRTRIVTVAYYALVDMRRLKEAGVRPEDMAIARLAFPKGKSASSELTVKGPGGRTLDLAFDHGAILRTAVHRLRGKIDYTPVAFELLPLTFTLFDLQKVHETVLGRKLNKDSFRRRMLASGRLEPTGELQQDVDHRPAALYRFLRSR